MATTKQLSFIKAICDELSLDEPRENISTREASKFISKYVTKFYAKKARDKEKMIKHDNNRHNYKQELSFRADEKILGMSTEQNIENLKNALRHCSSLSNWTGEKR